MRLEIVLKVRKCWIQSSCKEIGNTKLLISLISEDDLVVKIFNPFPEDLSMLCGGEFESLLNVF